MKKILFAIFSLLILQGLSYQGKACSTFCIDTKTDLVFGRNFDFSVGFGHVVINKRNVKKTSLIQTPEKPIEWISKYGSITFNQVGREFPYGGMNETGLVVECMWLAETKYPETDSRYGLEEVQWIQYQLDNSETVKDVIKSDSLIRISSLSTAPIHFFVCDKEGNKATIEYLNCKMVVHTGSDLPIPVLTNYTYDKSIKFLETKAEFGGTDTTSFTSKAYKRFTKAASMIKNYDDENAIDYSFDILDSVSQKKTRWSIVYDIKNMIIYFKTEHNQNRRYINFADMDFTCNSPSLFADIESNMVDQKFVLKEYSYIENRALIDSVCSKNKFLERPEQYKEAQARYPETTKCNE